MTAHQDFGTVVVHVYEDGRGPWVEFPLGFPLDEASRLLDQVDWWIQGQPLATAGYTIELQRHGDQLLSTPQAQLSLDIVDGLSHG